MGCECVKNRNDGLKSEEKPAVVEQQIDTRAETDQSGPAAPLSTGPITMLTTPLTAYYRLIDPKASLYSSKGALGEYIHIKKLCILRGFAKAGNKDLDRIREEFAAKIDVLAKLDHANIVQIYEVLEDKRNFYIISEAFHGGQLADYVTEIGGMNESMTANAISQVLEAICYSHNQGVVHRNLKLSNLYLKVNPSDEDLHIKLTGFDNSGPFASHKNTIGAPSCFTAPELFTGQGDQKCDIWSCGWILACLLVPQSQLFTAAKYAQYLQSGKKFVLKFKGEAWEKVNVEAKELVAKMLTWRSSDRPTAWDCLQHPWLSKHRAKIAANSRQVRGAIAHLVTSSQASELKYAVMQFILHRIIDSQTIARLTSSFKALDLNRDGQISREELLSGMKRIMTETKAEESVDTVIQKVERNWNGSVDYSEFLISAFGEEHLLSRENLGIIFNCLDRDLNGSISMQELKGIFFLSTLKRKEELWTQLLITADKSGDGQIDKEEFFEVMTKVLI